MVTLLNNQSRIKNIVMKIKPKLPSSIYWPFLISALFFIVCNNVSSTVYEKDSTPHSLTLPTVALPRSTSTGIRLSAAPQDPWTGIEEVGETEHFIFYDLIDNFPVDVEVWQAQTETVYKYVSERLDLEVREKIRFSFLKPDERPCPTRGMSGGSDIYIYADQSTNEKKLLGVLAHELGHAIPTLGKTYHLPEDITLLEGYATWAAGNYWTNWHGFLSTEDMVKTYLDENSYIPLYQSFNNMEGTIPGEENGDEDCLARRDILYTEWADFIEYLLLLGGKQKLYALFDSNSMKVTDTEFIIKSPDYVGVYGLPLNELEVNWLSYLEK
jgi:hypothetical protein